MAVVATCALLSAALCFALERTFPETPQWQLDRGEARADLLHALLSNPIPTLIFDRSSTRSWSALPPR